MKLIKNLLKIRAKLYHNSDNNIYYGEFIGSVNFEISKMEFFIF